MWFSGCLGKLHFGGVEIRQNYIVRQQELDWRVYWRVAVGFAVKRCKK